MPETTKTAEATGTPPLKSPRLKRFLLHRSEDESGVSGTGIVAEGVEFECGWCALSWLTVYQSCGIYPSVDEVLRIHGHDGRTRIVYLFDDEPLEAAVELHAD